MGSMGHFVTADVIVTIAVVVGFRLIVATVMVVQVRPNFILGQVLELNMVLLLKMVLAFAFVVQEFLIYNHLHCRYHHKFKIYLLHLLVFSFNFPNHHDHIDYLNHHAIISSHPSSQTSASVAISSSPAGSFTFHDLSHHITYYLILFISYYNRYITTISCLVIVMGFMGGEFEALLLDGRLGLFL